MFYERNEKMYRKFLVLVLVLMTAIMFIRIRLNANSGPIIDPGTSSHFLMIDKSTEIEVTSENLTFDFTNPVGLEMKEDGREMRVSATYTMNNTGEAKKVKMAFPFLGPLDYDYRKYAEVLVEGSKIDYDFYYSKDSGQSAYYQSGSEFPEYTMEEVLSETICVDPELINNAQGYLYSLTMPEPLDEISSYVFENDIVMSDVPQNASIYTNIPFFRFSEELTCNNYEAAPSSTIFIFTTKEVTLSNNTFAKKAGSSVSLPDTVATEWTVENVALEEYIDRALSQYLNQNESLDLPDEIYKADVYYKYDTIKPLTYQGVYDVFYDEAIYHNLVYIEGLNRMLMLVYDVDFEAGETKTVQVNYAAEAVRNSEHYTTDMYRIIYISTPAKYWKSFKDLTVEVISDSYIVDSNISFTREDGKYVAFLEQLPENNIVFHLSDVENVQHQRHSGYCGGRIYDLSAFFITVSLIGMIFIKRNKYSI
jgi:hypothetical protein